MCRFRLFAMWCFDAGTDILNENMQYLANISKILDQKYV